MSLNPQKMFNDKFGSPEQQNEEGFKQVFPNTVPHKKQVESLCKDVDLSKLGMSITIPTQEEGKATAYTINVPTKKGVEKWSFCTTSYFELSNGDIKRHCASISDELSKWGYALAVYSQLLDLKETEFDVWVKLQTNSVRANLLSSQPKAPTERYIEEMAIAQNYEEYVKRTSEIATLKNTKEMIRLAIVEPLKEKGKQLTNIVEVLKLVKGDNINDK